MGYIFCYHVIQNRLIKEAVYSLYPLAIQNLLQVTNLHNADHNHVFLVMLQVLMRALRDFNLPKIVTDDVPIIMGLIGDLFPSLDVPRKRDMDFEKLIRQATLDQKLQPEDNFILKVSSTCPWLKNID